MTIRPALALLVLGLAAPALQAQDLDWQTYQDTVYDCRVEYPAGLFAPEPLDVTEDVQRFSGPDEGTYFRVMGVDNSERLSPAQVKAKYLAADIPGDVTYERTKDEFLVLSGFRGESIFYTKVAMAPDESTLCILEITYPKGQKERFDPIVTRMSRAFKVRR
jgi:hypothetical protein